MTVLMILIFATHVERQTPTLPHPPIPLGLTVNPAEYRASLDSRLDALEVRCISTTDKTNYQRWCDNGREWLKEEYDTPKLPTKARPAQSQLSYGLMSYAYWKRYVACCLPWQQYIERVTWQERCPHDVVWYNLIQHPTTESTFYVAELDALPHLKVRAKTLEELEKNVVERFISFIDGLCDSEMIVQSTAGRSLVYPWVGWKGAPNYLDGWDFGY